MKRSRFFYLATLMGSLLVAVVFLLANSSTARSASVVPEGVNGIMPPVASLAQPGQIGYLTGASAADPLTIVLDHLAANAAHFGLSAADIASYEITDRYVTAHNGVTHIYLRQKFNGLAVHQATVAGHVAADGRLVALHSSFVPSLAARYVNQPVSLSAADAVTAAADHLGLEMTEAATVLEAAATRDQAVILSDAGISFDPIPARLMLQYTDAGDVRQVWNVVINERSGLHWWDAYVDAATGQVLTQIDWVVNENLNGSDGHAEVAFVDHLSETAANDAGAAAGPNNAYFVIPFPYESPDHFDGNNGMTTPGALIVDPADNIASPFAWHDTDGSAGAEFTDTQGNNVLAAADTNGDNVPDPGSMPDGGANLVFNIPADFSQNAPFSIDSAVINLFYWNNIVHDLTYWYGFDEASGNFQENNYGNGGLGSDFVNADAQDTGNCNANFGTPADGSNPRMQMYTCNNASPSRDTDFDNGVIAHEYGHGISNRLTGGPANPGCLSNDEQMGEGWSDIMTLFMNDDGVTTVRPVGSYSFNLPGGIRNFPYSPNFGVNPHTYNDIIGTGSPHALGEVWATMYWDMHQLLVGEYGFDADLYTGSGGNNIAFQLMMDGLKLQTCSPGFVDGRDAILQADLVNTGGANYCTIWSAFATRGLGWSADQGSSFNRNDGTEAFDMPPGCLTIDALPDAQSVCAGSTAMATVVAGTAFSGPVTLSVTGGEPAGSTVGFSPNPIATNPGVSTLSVGVPGAATGGLYTLTIQGTDAIGPDNVGGGSTTLSTTTDLNVVEDAPAAPALTSPANGATEVQFDPTFTWGAAAGTDVYQLQVATDSGFSNVILDVNVGTTTYTPTDFLPHSTTLYWRVRGANSCGDGGWSSTFDFTTIVAISCTGGFAVTTLLSFDFDSGEQGWTHGGTGDTWALEPETVEGGGNQWHADDPETLSDQRLISPDIVLPNSDTSHVVSFWNQQQFETPNGDGRCWDAGIFEISTDGGSSWSYVPNSEMITDPYNNIIWNDQAGNNPITNDYGAVEAWCSENAPWTEAYVDVSAYAGETVRVALRLGSDSAAGNDGWTVDDVSVLSCSTGDSLKLPLIRVPQ